MLNNSWFNLNKGTLCCVMSWLDCVIRCCDETLTWILQYAYMTLYMLFLSCMFYKHSALKINTYRDGLETLWKCCFPVTVILKGHWRSRLQATCVFLSELQIRPTWSSSCSVPPSSSPPSPSSGWSPASLVAATDLGYRTQLPKDD